MKRIFFAIAILPWTLMACHTARDKNELQEVEIQEVQKSKPEELKDQGVLLPDTSSITAFAAPEMPTENQSTPVAINWDKKIIKNANVKLEVKEHAAYSQYIRNTVGKYGGYISQEENHVTDEKAETVMSIKVPVLQFESLVNALSTSEAKQLERSITSEDVTGSIIDTKARLETRKATRSKYLEFLKQAGKIEDVLKVQQEINAIQEDIESAETRLAQLSGQARFSTIDLTYFEPMNGYNPDNDKPGIGRRIITAFADGGKFFADIFIGLLTVWPLWMGAVIAILIFRKVRIKRDVRKNPV